MKRSFLLVFLLWISIGGGVIAQNRSIRFEPKDWKKAVEKARKENKLIFLDCHTSWCGPCKNLAANIFTKDAVADFYNQNFINVDMDMEKDVDGVMLSKVYKPTAFPTLLFIDPHTELVVHRVTGGGDVEYILSIARVPLSSDNTLARSCRRYRQGVRSPEFVKKLMNDLKLAHAKKMHREVAEAYFDRLNQQQLEEKENWELFKAHIDNPYSAIFKKIMSGHIHYGRLFGEDEVAKALQWIVIMELGDIAGSSLENGLQETENRYQELIGLLEYADFQGVSALITDARFSKALLQDCGTAWLIVQNGNLYNRTEDEIYGLPFFTFYYPLGSIMPVLEDRVILTELSEIINRIKLRCTSMPYLARLALNSAVIYEKMRETEKAEQARTEYESYCNMR